MLTCKNKWNFEKCKSTWCPFFLMIKRKLERIKKEVRKVTGGVDGWTYMS